MLSSKPRMRPLFTSALVAAAAACATAADPPSWRRGAEAAIAEVKQIGHESKNARTAIPAARKLAQLPPDAIPAILTAAKDANPLAANLLLASIETIVDRAGASKTPLPTNQLEAFLHDTDQDPRARRFAFELLTRTDPAAEARLVPTFLHDPSPELRRDAVAYTLAEADRLKASGKNDEAKAAYEKALSGAIHDDQVRTIVEALKGYGDEIDLQKHFGFITAWRIIGPFDNRGMLGFEAVYPPEQQVDLDATYQGQLGEVSWQPIATEDPYGVIDIAKQVENYKGSAMYLAAEFDAAESRPVEIRLGTPNSWKLWVNGEFLFGREEYHRGEELDQYRVPATLQAGRNLILLKILQNEQSDDWAQSYKFRLRVTD